LTDFLSKPTVSLLSKPPSAIHGLGQVALHESVGERDGDTLPGEKDPVVNRADQAVDGEVDVRGPGQFAAAAGAQERRAVPVTLPGHDLGLEPGGDGRVVLRLPGQGPEHGAGVCRTQERGQLAQLVPEVAAQVSVVSRGEELSRVDGEGVKQDVGLGGPPAVDGLLGFRA
jgi:hypothetical protein